MPGQGTGNTLQMKIAHRGLFYRRLYVYVCRQECVLLRLTVSKLTFTLNV